jgi:hypothetical protein
LSVPFFRAACHKVMLQNSPNLGEIGPQILYITCIFSCMHYVCYLGVLCFWASLKISRKVVS